MAANGIFFLCGNAKISAPRAKRRKRERERSEMVEPGGKKKKKKDAGADNSASARSWDDVGFISADASRPKCRVRNEWLHFLRPSVGLSLSLSLSLPLWWAPYAAPLTLSSAPETRPKTNKETTKLASTRSKPLQTLS